MHYKTVLLLGVMALNGCVVVDQPTIHALTLKWFGKSYNQNVRPVSLKQLHLEQRQFVGKVVMVSGTVHFVGELGTYFVLRQGERKLLVMQHDILHNELRIHPDELASSVRVVGPLTSQKKDLPALIAQYVVVDDGG